MKKLLLSGFMIMFFSLANSQENGILFSGGYSFASIDGLHGSGWRINGQYEFTRGGGRLSHGLSLGLIHLSANEKSLTSTVNSWPLYYAPKYTITRDKLKFYLRGAIGLQVAGIKREGIVSLDDTDYGFYGGGSAGIMILLGEKIYLNADYEIAWASNSWYNDGLINTASAGLEFRF